VDGERGTVESVELYGVEGQPRWAVAVRTDKDGEVWSGTQDTAAKGAWVKLTAAQLATDELDSDAHPWNDFARAVADHDAATEHVAAAAAAPRKVAVVESVERHDLTEIPTASEAVDALAATALRISTETAIAALTDAGREFMRAVGKQSFDFFDEGIVAGSGNWGENMSWQYAAMSGRKPRSVSGIMARLSVAGLWELSDGDPDQGKWWSLTELGAAVALQLAATEKQESAAISQNVKQLAAAIAPTSVERVIRESEAPHDFETESGQTERTATPCAVCGRKRSAAVHGTETRTQRASRAACCDWFGCANNASTTRELAGRTWSVCSSHA
jgi:hypothetical protein